MEGKGYLDFDLRFAKSENGYRAEILKSPAGTAQGIFQMPFQDIELENYLLKIGQRRSGMRKIDSPENRAAGDFGSKLYNGVFRATSKPFSAKASTLRARSTTACAFDFISAIRPNWRICPGSISGNHNAASFSP